MYPVSHDTQRAPHTVQAIIFCKGDRHETVMRKLNEHGNEGILRRLSWKEDRFMFADGPTSSLREVQGRRVLPKPSLSKADLLATDWQFEAMA